MASVPAWRSVPASAALKAAPAAGAEAAEPGEQMDGARSAGMSPLSRSASERATETHGQAWAEGMRLRTEVLGEEAVLRSVGSATELSADVQDLATEYCWGTIWSRPELDRRTRSIINLAMLTALNRGHEFRLHVHGALNNGVTTAEIRETLLQATVYCGMPAGLEAFRLADSVIQERNGR